MSSNEKCRTGVSSSCIPLIESPIDDGLEPYFIISFGDLSALNIPQLGSVAFVFIFFQGWLNASKYTNLRGLFARSS